MASRLLRLPWGYHCNYPSLCSPQEQTVRAIGVPLLVLLVCEHCRCIKPTAAKGGSSWA
jgi:hypothetical protein